VTVKPLVLRERARRDIEAAVDFYAGEAGAPTAERFVASLQATLSSIQARPALGSPSLGYELGLPGLRSRPLRRFPYLVFYVETEAAVDVWRVLHTRRDIPAGLTGSGA
jgi:toxin ParE1/3/4